MQGDFDLFQHNISGLFNGMYEPLCSFTPPENALEMFLHDVVTAACYAAIPVVLVLGWNYFMWLKHLGYLIVAYAVFIFFCGTNHLTGWALELGGFVGLDLTTARLTTLCAVTALFLTVAWASKIAQPLRALGDALREIRPE